MILETIAKYWVQEVCVVLCGLLGILGKKLWTRYKRGKEEEEQEKLEEHDRKILDKIGEMCKAVTDRIDALEQQMNAMEKRNNIQDENTAILKSGILSLQKELFLKEGRDLLEAGHIVTYDEYMAYTQQHTLYNRLGGNHEGDEQFKLVTKKYQSGLTNFEAHEFHDV